MEAQKLKITDILFGVGIPIVLVILIWFLAVYINPSGSQHLLGQAGALGTVGVILTQGFLQMIVLGVPLVLGLLWNKWAGGAAGFIMGGLYYVASAGQYNGTYAAAGVTTYNFFGDVSMIFYVVNAIIIGYIAGSLSNGSTNFKRMLGAGLTAAITTAIIQSYMNYTISLAPAQQMAQGLWATDLPQAILINFVPSIALGVIVPILAKVMTWYGLSPRKLM